MVNPLQIGALTVEFPFVLAPMAGYTDSSMRTLCRRHGCGMVFTEVVNAQGLLHGSKQTFHLLEASACERPVGAHIYGRDPGEMAEAALLIEGLQRFDLIDINCGCPVRKIVAKGCGAALMSDPERVARIVSAVGAAVSIPVTVKTRTGLSEDRKNISEIAHAVEQGGGEAVFIHARFASRRHAGPSDWETLSEVKRERSIPVVGNGGVACAADAVEMIRQTGVDGVMIGRAAVGNPWIFDEIRHIVTGRDYHPYSLDEFRSVIVEQLEIMEKLHEKARRYRRRGSLPAAESAALHFRGHLYQYLKGLRGWGEVRRSLRTMNSREKIVSAVDMLIERQREGSGDAEEQG